jgi:hypothetical protein
MTQFIEVTPVLMPEGKAAPTVRINVAQIQRYSPTEMRNRVGDAVPAVSLPTSPVTTIWLDDGHEIHVAEDMSAMDSLIRNNNLRAIISNA